MTDKSFPDEPEKTTAEREAEARERARAAMNDLFYNGADKSSSQLYKQAGNSIVVGVLEKDIEQLRGKR